MSMSLSEETKSSPPPSQAGVPLTTGSDRRSDVDAKQSIVAGLLQEVECDGLLILEPDNFSWLSGGGASRGNIDPASFPALYFTTEGRWVLSANVDSQRLFDEELDGLGFQLKEWPWNWGRPQLLADLCQGRNVACDQPLLSCKVVADKLQRRRRSLSDYERACYRALGQVVSHALEATGRTLNVGDTEREIAGQLSHRLLHRGVYPVVLSVAADGRSRRYRQGGFTGTPIGAYCVLTAVGRKYGLTAMASRAVMFGQADPIYRKEHDSACRVSATYIASSWPDAMPKQILATGRRVFQVAEAEHEWLLCPQGHVTGHAAVELNLTPTTEDLLQAGWAITWNTTVGAASSCDTFLITEDGPRSLTPPENWPLKRIRIQGAEFVRPDVLAR
jgi:Xaa-Pro aminopeptidase